MRLSAVSMTAERVLQCARFNYFNYLNYSSPWCRHPFTQVSLHSSGSCSGADNIRWRRLISSACWTRIDQLDRVGRLGRAGIGGPWPETPGPVNRRCDRIDGGRREMAGGSRLRACAHNVKDKCSLIDASCNGAMTLRRRWSEAILQWRL